MSSLQEIKLKAEQVSPNPITEGAMDYAKMSQLGQLWTADWIHRLVMAGVVYSANLGTGSGDASYTALTGNATVDNDQPEFVLSINSGWLIPIEIRIDISVDDLDAYDDVDDVLFMVDRSQAYTAATATAVTPVNLLDGGAAFEGFCTSIVTADITNPVGSDILLYGYKELTQVATEASGPGIDGNGPKSFHRMFTYPRFIAGPCSILGYVTGTNTPTFMGEVVFAHLPASWVKVT